MDATADILEKHYRGHVAFLRLWRLGQSLMRLHVPLLPTGIRLLCRIVFQADIPLEVSAPPGVIFMHNGLGTVIHTRTRFLGPAVVFHNVTIGNSLGLKDGVPVIGSHVIIGAGAAILGPVTIGDACVIGANAVVTRDIPVGSLVVGNPSAIKRGDPALIANIFGSLPASLASLERLAA